MNKYINTQVNTEKMIIYSSNFSKDFGGKYYSKSSSYYVTFLYNFFLFNIIKKVNDILSNFRNVKEYILLLPIREQIDEINKMIEYHMNYNHPRLNIRNKYMIVNHFKDF